MGHIPNEPRKAGERGEFLRGIFLGMKHGEAIAQWQIVDAYAKRFYPDRTNTEGRKIAYLALSVMFAGAVCKRGWGKRGEDILVKVAHQTAGKAEVIYLWMDRLEFASRF